MSMRLIAGFKIIGHVPEAKILLFEGLLKHTFKPPAIAGLL